MWNELWIALALVLVIEGIIPFLSPDAMRKMVMAVLQMDDRTLRITGFFSMMAGVVMLYLVN